MAKLSNANQFFDDCRTAVDQTAFIQQLVTTRKTENDWLDFIQFTTNDDDLKENWFKALAGFGSTGDGVIVWGIEAKKGPDGIDAASKIVSVENPAAFETKLRVWQRQGTNPPVPNVLYHVIEDKVQPGRGFVVCLIPESTLKPHRAEISGKSQYYFRAGDSFQIPSPSVLRHMFFPYKNPNFRIWGTLRYNLVTTGSVNNGKYKMDCIVDLENVGMASAHECIVSIFPRNKYSQKVENHEPRWSLYENSNTRFVLASDNVIHPAFGCHVCDVSWIVEPSTLYSSTEPTSRPRLDDCHFDFIVYARDMNPQYISLDFDMRFLRTRQTETDRTIGIARSEPTEII